MCTYVYAELPPSPYVQRAPYVLDREERARGSSGLVIQPTTVRSKGRYRERRKKYILARIQAHCSQFHPPSPLPPFLPTSLVPHSTTHSHPHPLFLLVCASPRSSFSSRVQLPLRPLLYLSRLSLPRALAVRHTRACTRVCART